MVDELPGLDVEPVRAWLADRLPGAGRLEFELIAAGGSNLTFRASDGDGRSWALRRPPEGRGLATAHDVDREWRVLTALTDAGAPVPVPTPVAHCDDPAVTGAPFYVMGFCEGTILRTEHDAAALGPAVASTASRSLVATQVALHDLDVDEIGLGDLGPRTGYVDRQLRRWSKQVGDGAGRDLPELHELHDRLVATVPPEPARPSLIHGDYRFDNVVLAEDGTVAAVLDWELATLGDPVADACWSLLYWADSDDPDAVLPSSPTLAHAVPDRAWAAGQYEHLSGRSLDTLPWFTAFGWWKMACIVEGVYARRRAGARGGGPTGDVEAIATRVDRLLQVAREAAHAAGL